jgi:predicted Zn-dependent peptidase
VKVLDQHLPLAVDILSDIVLRPAFNAIDIEREKKVILEEIKMVEDTPDDLVHELFTQAFWEGHPLGRPILGTKESVEGSRSSGCASIFAAPTRPRTSLSRRRATSNIALCARRSKSVRRNAVGRTKGNVVAAAVIPKVVIRSKELEQSHICLGASSYPQNHDARYSSYVLNTMLGGSMSSRLFQNIREKRGLAYSVFSGINAYSDAGSLTVYAGCANEAVGEVIDLVVERNEVDQADPGARQRASTREGSFKRQRHAESREHGEPDVASGPSGDLLRQAVQP